MIGGSGDLIMPGDWMNVGIVDYALEKSGKSIKEKIAKCK